ncbi:MULTISPECIES: CBS domain-containing protein [Myroides]|uniref:CBS domain-containing protein n=1 Tax=Myroides albus TaxID=2562892 RepID=A0A6I3LF35_9FLAO|nr:MULTISPECIES: CBS domain-containing protein [Myroides]MTG98079.1 CBS domain-containing protein [Myroides albus]MVX36283.1 CBS domain-containing protein [Myroides sp. LoEW2-1]UVD80741.1 CBS domain-containing protein [Myroides albus]
MRQRVPVSSIMTSTIVSLNLTDSLTDAEKLFKMHKIRHLPVVSGHKLVGILSYTDLLKISLADTDEDDNIVDTTVYNMFTLEQVMVKNVTTIQADDNIKDAAEILVKKDFRALPVLDGQVLVGMLTTTDLIKYLLNQYD